MAKTKKSTSKKNIKTTRVAASGKNKPVILITNDDGVTAPGILNVGSSRVDLQACKLEYSIVSPK